jgi:hypothetical protein
MKIIFFVLGLFASFHCYANQYELLKKTENSSLYYVKGSFDKSGPNGSLSPYVSLVVNSKKGFTTNNGMAYSMQMFVVLNCNERRQIVESVIFYSSTFTEGVTLAKEPNFFDNQKIYKVVFDKFCNR